MIIPLFLEYQAVMSTAPASPGVCAMESFCRRGTDAGTKLKRMHEDKECFLDKSDRELQGTDRKKYFSKLVARTKLKLSGRQQQNITEKKTLTCHQCKYTTDRKNNLKRHIVTMHQNCNKILECCGVLFESKSSLKEHVSLFHSSGYQCQVCGRNFCRKALLRRHLSVHSGQKDYKCPLCSYATSHKSNLERHQKVHDKKFSNSDGLHFNTTGGSLNKSVSFVKKPVEETKYFSKCKSLSKRNSTSLQRSPLKLKDSKTELKSKSDQYTKKGSVAGRTSTIESQTVTSRNSSGNNSKDFQTDEAGQLDESNSLFTFKDLSKFENTDSYDGFIPKNDTTDITKTRTQNSVCKSYLTKNDEHSSLNSDSYIFSNISRSKDGLKPDRVLSKNLDKNLLDENSNFPPVSVTNRESSYRTDNVVLKFRLCTSPYKCQVCCDTFTSQFEFLNHCCDSVNQKRFLLPVTCMVMKKNQVR